MVSSLYAAASGQAQPADRESFLTFSRMERNKYSLEFAPLHVEDVVAAAEKASGQHFHEPVCQLRVEVMPDLPEYPR